VYKAHDTLLRTDIAIKLLYSLGIVLFEMVTGRRPFNGDSIQEVERKHLEVAPPNPGEVRPGVPDAVSSIILRCLAKDPAERFQTAAELSESLAALEL
jgi:serine/threonine-protein kinase